MLPITFDAKNRADASESLKVIASSLALFLYEEMML